MCSERRILSDISIERKRFPLQYVVDMRLGYAAESGQSALGEFAAAYAFPEESDDAPL